MEVMEVFDDYDGHPFSDAGEGRDVIVIAEPDDRHGVTAESSRE